MGILIVRQIIFTVELKGLEGAGSSKYQLDAADGELAGIASMHRWSWGTHRRSLLVATDLDGILFWVISTSACLV